MFVNVNIPGFKYRTWKIGERIGEEWEVVKECSGGFGMVYLASNKKLSETVSSMPRIYALKTFRPEIYKGSTTFDDFDREAYVWLRLGKHDFIVQAFFLERYEGMPFVVSEGIVNERFPNTLRGWISTPQMTMENVIFIGAQICIGMEYANSKGIKYHCDLKPENIFITDMLYVKIGDWGLSTLTNAALVESVKSSSLSCFPFSYEKATSRTVGGTIPYMAPEILKGTSPDVASDIYAFGAIMYEMLTSRLPFQATTANDWVHAHFSESPTPLTQLRNDIPKSLDDLVLSCLSKAPDERPESFACLKESLAEILRAETGWMFSQAFLQAESSGMSETSFEQELRARALHKLGVEEEAQRLRVRSLTPEEANKSHVFLWEDGEDDGAAGMRIGKYRIGISSDTMNAAEARSKKYPDDPESWANLGNLYHLAGRFDDARSSYHQAARLEPNRKQEVEDIIVEIDKSEVDSCIERGSWYVQRGDSTGALKVYMRALEVDRWNAILWYNIGTVKQVLADLKGSETALAMATSLDPNLVQAWNSLGGARLQLGDPTGALKCFDKAIALDSSLKKPWLNRGGALKMLGKYNEAIQSVCKALEIDPDYEMARNTLEQYLKDTTH